MWQALFWELGILDIKQNQAASYCRRAYCLVGKTNNQVNKAKITIVVNTLKGKHVVRAAAATTVSLCNF